MSFTAAWEAMSNTSMGGELKAACFSSFCPYPHPREREDDPLMLFLRFLIDWIEDHPEPVKKKERPFKSVICQKAKPWNASNWPPRPRFKKAGRYSLLRFEHSFKAGDRGFAFFRQGKQGVITDGHIVYWMRPDYERYSAAKRDQEAIVWKEMLETELGQPGICERISQTVVDWQGKLISYR